MTIGGAALALMLACAPQVGPTTLAGVITVESGWHEFAIHDNTNNVSYCTPGAPPYPCSLEAAASIAQTLRNRGANIDAGLMQINNVNWNGYGLDTTTVFEPCRNVRAGGAILTRGYLGAVRSHYYAGTDALIAALSAYNSGNYHSSRVYATSVIAAAQRISFSSARVQAPSQARTQAARREHIAPHPSAAPVATSHHAAAEPSLVTNH